MSESKGHVAGIDVGTECVKVIVLEGDAKIVGRSVIPTRGRFQNCVEVAFRAALAEAGIERGALEEVCATGFGARSVQDASFTASGTLCHARGAAHYVQPPVMVIDIGGREPCAIQVDADGRPRESRSVRRCAAGIGTFLMFAARHLDVHPTRLEELAAGADRPAAIGSYCSVFSGTEILERLLDGCSPEEIALGCIRSIAERIYEIGEIKAPVAITGGVPEYFPGVLRELEEMTGVEVQTVPEPIMAGALGAALQARDAARSARLVAAAQGWARP